MLEKLKDWLAKPKGGTETVEETEEQRIALAAAMLLLEVAWADHEITEDELSSVQTSLRSLYGIDSDQVDAIVADARKTHEESSSIFPFTRELNDSLNYQERTLLLEHLWRLITFKDASFHYEEHAIRKVADLLYVRHSDFIKAKLKATAKAE